MVYKSKKTSSAFLEVKNEVWEKVSILLEDGDSIDDSK